MSERIKSWEIAQWVTYLPHQHEALASDPQEGQACWCAPVTLGRLTLGSGVLEEPWSLLAGLIPTLTIITR